MKNVLNYFLTLKEKKLEPHWVFQQFFFLIYYMEWRDLELNLNAILCIAHTFAIKGYAYLNKR